MMVKIERAIRVCILGLLLESGRAWLSVRTANSQPFPLQLYSTSAVVVVDDSQARSAFGTKEYWDETYLGRGDFPADEYSWYYGWETIGKHIKQHIPDKKSKMLLPGIGNDPILLDLLGNGYEHLTAQDYSQHAVDRQNDLLESQANLPGTVSVTQGDVRDLPTEWSGQFDVVVEKGMLDAVYLSGDGNMEAAVDNLAKVLRPGGLILSVSGVVPAELRKLLFREWEWIRDGTDDLQAGCFVLKKK